MPVRLKNGSVFLHIPKTGGTWVKQILVQLDLAERDPVRAEPLPKIFGGKHAVSEFNGFAFCFIRHPLTWYESFFKYQTKIGWKNYSKSHPMSPLNGTRSANFNDFINKCLKASPRYLSKMMEPFIERADFIGKQENLTEDLIKVLRRLNLNIDESYIKKYKMINRSLKTRFNWEPKLVKTMKDNEYAILRYYE